MTPHIMLDCETLGVGNEPVLLSIGAVKFTADEIVDRFHVAIDPETCQLFGLKINASTVMWWLEDDRQPARAALLAQERHALPDALRGFAQWLGDPAPVWGNGATADNVWLRNAFRAIGDDCPWSYRLDRCYRTVKNLAPAGLEPSNSGVAHDALDDAVWQARHLMAICAHTGLPLA